VIVDTYDGFKGLPKRKFGADSTLVSAVNSLEARPDSAPRREALQEELATAKPDRNPDILHTVKDLLVALKTKPTVAQHIQTATGNYIAQTSGEKLVEEVQKGDVHGRLDHESLGRSLHQVGMCLSRLGQDAEARLWYERAVEEAQKGDVHGRVDPASLQMSLDALEE
jgi:hypothetical protein